MTYHDCLSQAAKINKVTNVNKLLLLHLLKKDFAWLYGNLAMPVTVPFYQKYLALVTKYTNGYPLAYLLGYEWFCGQKFIVNENVLIPRNETEELVHNVLKHAEKNFPQKPIRLLDLGTGSGAIAISIALVQPQWEITASDISLSALAVAKINSKNHHCNNITFVMSDLFANLDKDNFDIIVCNPPYIDDQNDFWQNSSLRFEPQLALFAANKGLYFYELILQNCHKIMTKPFLLALEIGYDQKPLLMPLLNKYCAHFNYHFIKDINNKWRMIFIFR